MAALLAGMPTPTDPSSTLRAAIHALRAQFFVAGALFATWGVHVPSVKAHYGLSEQSLAIAMLAGGAGAVVALPYAGRVLARYAPRRVVPLMGLVCMLAVGSLLWPSLYGLLLALMLVYGMAAALFDVAINDEATSIERQSGRPLMSGFHGMFSLGGMAGAATWSVLAPAGVSAIAHLASASAVLGALALVLVQGAALTHVISHTAEVSAARSGERARFDTDWQKMAYVLREGEKDVPEGLKRALANTHALQDALRIEQAAPGSFEVLSVAVVPKEARFAEAPVGVITDQREQIYRRTLYTHAPARLEYGEKRTMTAHATVRQASSLRRWWTRVWGIREFYELYDVGFEG